MSREQLSAELEAAGLDVLYDDRPKVSPGVKFGDAELVGVPWIVIVGRGAADGQVELWDRRTGDREVVSTADAVARLTAADREAPCRGGAGQRLTFSLRIVSSGVSFVTSALSMPAAMTILPCFGSQNSAVTGVTRSSAMSGVSSPSSNQMSSEGE